MTLEIEHPLPLQSCTMHDKPTFHHIKSLGIYICQYPYTISVCNNDQSQSTVLAPGDYLVMDAQNTLLVCTKQQLTNMFGKKILHKLCKDASPAQGRASCQTT